MKKRLIYLMPFLVILIVGIIFSYSQQVPNPGHGGNELLVSVDGYTMTLQEAIDNGFLVDNGPSATQSYTSSVSKGHSENIFVSVSGAEKNIGQAISSSLCGSGSDVYNSAITLGHNANEIWVSVGGVEMTFQNAINSGKFCCVDTSWTPATSSYCSGTPFTQTSNCGTTRGAIGTKVCIVVGINSAGVEAGLNCAEYCNKYQNGRSCISIGTDSEGTNTQFVWRIFNNCVYSGTGWGCVGHPSSPGSDFGDLMIYGGEGGFLCEGITPSWTRCRCTY